MACLAPITVPVERNGRRHLERVRCGRCTPCRIRRKQAWTGRLLLEGLEHEHSRFLTLTYEQAKRPDVLDYGDFQLFMKRYRKGRSACRFFCVGEYGERGTNPHWHVIVFGHAQEFVGHADIPAWNKGYTFDAPGNPQTYGYVAGYVLKKMLGHPDGYLVRMSLKPGIGLNTIEGFAREAARIHSDVPLKSWPGRFSMDHRTFPLSDGALAKFKAVFSKEGGLPPREDDPDERHLLNLYYKMGDSFFEERWRRDQWHRLETGEMNGLPAKPRQQF